MKKLFMIDKIDKINIPIAPNYQVSADHPTLKRPDRTVAIADIQEFISELELLGYDNIIITIYEKTKIKKVWYFSGTEKKSTFVIVTEEENSERRFGGSFIKFALKGDSYNTVWVSSTLPEQELKDILWCNFNQSRAGLYRFW